MTSFQAHRNDYIVLASDALAQWILEQYQARKDPWQRLLSVETPKDFKEIIDYCRASGELVVDDTTMVIIPL